MTSCSIAKLISKSKKYNDLLCGYAHLRYRFGIQMGTNPGPRVWRIERGVLKCSKLSERLSAKPISILYFFLLIFLTFHNFQQSPTSDLPYIFKQV